MSNTNNNNDYDYDYKKVVPPRLQRFYEIVGREKYEQVLDELGGNPLYINCKESYDRAKRNRAIYEDYLKGMEYFELTSKYKLSMTMIRNITAQCRAQDKEQDKDL